MALLFHATSGFSRSVYPEAAYISVAGDSRLCLPEFTLRELDILLCLALGPCHC